MKSQRILKAVREKYQSARKKTLYTTKVAFRNREEIKPFTDKKIHYQTNLTRKV
jgi:hypothetical protein